jgi:hypothetical protein
MSAFVAMNSATRRVLNPRRESKNDENSLQGLIAVVSAGTSFLSREGALLDPSPSWVIPEA